MGLRRPGDRLLGDHMDVRKAAADPSYVQEKLRILKKYKLVLGARRPPVGAMRRRRLRQSADGFAPAAVHGQPEKLRAWAVEEMKITAKAARL